MTSEAELVGHRGRGEADAFDVLVERYGQTLFRYAYTLTQNADDAQDITQETFMTAWAKRRDVRIVDGSVLPWLLVTTKQHASNFYRKRARRGDEPLGARDAVDTSRTPFELVVDREHLEWIESTISNLSPDLRHVVVACLIEERSYQDVASELGLEVSTVTKRVSRARARLRDQRDPGAEGVRR